MDTSGHAVGGILSQGTVGKDLPIAYASRSLNNAEKNYSTIEQELFAIVYCVNHFRPYLYGRKFVLVTDYKPLVWLHSVRNPTSRLVRWCLKLAEYEYEVIYKAGKTNVNVDVLSRNPISACITKISQILVLENDPIPSDSDESIFSPTPKQNTSNKTNTPKGREKVPQDPRGDQIIEIEDYANTENEASSESQKWNGRRK